MASSRSTSETPVFSLRELLEQQLRDLFDACLQYSGYLPQMQRAATSAELRRQLEVIQREAEDAITHLAHACTLLGIDPAGQPCEAMKGLIREAREQAVEPMESAARDAALISQVQRIAHYGIAGYGTAREFARCLKLPEVGEILNDLLRTSSEQDRAMTRLAVGGWFSPGINREAADSAA